MQLKYEETKAQNCTYKACPHNFCQINNKICVWLNNETFI